MTNPLKILIEGTLFAECVQYGNLRSGMHRVAEEVNNVLLKNQHLDIAYANAPNSTKKQKNLKQYFEASFPDHTQKVLGKSSILSTLPYYSKVSRKLGFDSEADISPTIVNNINVFHSFYYPFSLNTRQSSIVKTITYLDIIPLRLPGYPPSLVNLTKKIIDSIVPNYAISISQFSKDDLCDLDKRVDPARVFVVPLAADSRMFKVNKDAHEWRKVKNKYSLPDNFFLSIASTDARKNQQHLVQCFADFVMQENIDDLFLVSTGNSSFNESILDSWSIPQEVRSKIVFSRPIDEQDLSSVYSNALAFFFMSRYEGFGLPAPEAMQCGIPVVSSNCTSLPEVMGDAGIMVPPTDKGALSQAMVNLYKSKDFRETLSAACLQQANKFSWEQTAAAYAEIFMKVST